MFRTAHLLIIIDTELPFGGPCRLRNCNSQVVERREREDQHQRRRFHRPDEIVSGLETWLLEGNS